MALPARVPLPLFALLAHLALGVSLTGDLFAGERSPTSGPAVWPAPGLVILHQHATANGRVVAYWLGRAPEVDDPIAYLPYATEQLWFEFRDPGSPQGRKVLFRPSGELFFSDWTFDVFSPDDEAVVLLQDHYGPFHVVWTRDLEKYIRGQRRATEIVPTPRAKRDIAAVHKFIGWISSRTFDFYLACCASRQDGRHTVGSGQPSDMGPFRKATDY